VEINGSREVARGVIKSLLWQAAWPLTLGSRAAAWATCR
jgi:hypothetical protein